MSKTPETVLTAEQKRILRVFWEADRDMCYTYAYFEDELKRSRAELTKDFVVLRSLGYIYYARGLMDEDGRVAGSGYGVTYEKVKEIEALLPPHEHSWKIHGDRLHCVSSSCYEWITLEVALEAAKREARIAALGKFTDHIQGCAAPAAWAQDTGPYREPTVEPFEYLCNCQAADIKAEIARLSHPNQPKEKQDA